MTFLGVNIDHIATLRQARGEDAPDPVAAARICEKAGANSIVCHLREDARHIQKEDVIKLRHIVKTRLNLEMSLDSKVVSFALKIKPDQATIVPERRQELTTEGGLDVKKYFRRVKQVTALLQKNGIEVSLFVDPKKEQIQKSAEAGVSIIELHTGEYSRARTKAALKRELENLKSMTQYGRGLGLIVNAGHGLKYNNTKAVASIEGMHELNIGHSIIARAVFVGLETAVREMIKLIK